MKHLFLCAALLGAVRCPLTALAQTDPDPQRFESEIDRFREWDRKNTPPGDAVLFVGSSSIRLWNTAEAFPDLVVMNRGFGGAHISDVNHFISETVLRYRPQTIVFYAGDNDVWDGKPAERVRGDFEQFLAAVTAVRPDAQVLYVSIKPSPSRWRAWPEMHRANMLISAMAQESARLTFVDIAPAMLGAGGEPDSALFVPDMLHLNEEGYVRWNAVVAPLLEPSE